MTWRTPGHLAFRTEFRGVPGQRYGKTHKTHKTDKTGTNGIPNAIVVRYSPCCWYSDFDYMEGTVAMLLLIRALMRSIA